MELALQPFPRLMLLYISFFNSRLEINKYSTDFVEIRDSLNYFRAVILCDLLEFLFVLKFLRSVNRPCSLSADFSSHLKCFIEFDYYL